MSPSTTFSIRQLVRNDVALMQDMMTVFGEAFEDMKTYTHARPSAEYLQRLLGGSHFIALAALSEGALVGGLTAYELVKFEQERSEIYIYDLAVADGHRRQGIATALLAELKTIAVSRGAHVIYVQANLGDDAAIEFYSKIGMREDVLHFDIEIG